MFLHDAAAHPETQSGTALTLGGNKWFKEPSAVFGRNTDSVVGDHHSHAEPMSVAPLV